MSRSVVLLLLSPGLAKAQLTTIHLFTKPAAPMSMLLSDGATVGGYSIQFWRDYVAPKLGVTDVRTTMLANNNEVMGGSGLQSPLCSSSTTLCIGERSQLSSAPV